MRVLIRPTREDPGLRAALRKDGWRLTELPERALLVRHPRVADEQDARARLDQLGLLTSGAFRIEFLSDDRSSFSLNGPAG